MYGAKLMAGKATHSPQEQPDGFNFVMMKVLHN